MEDGCVSYSFVVSLSGHHADRTGPQTSKLQDVNWTVYRIATTCRDKIHHVLLRRENRIQTDSSCYMERRTGLLPAKLLGPRSQSKPAAGCNSCKKPYRERYLSNTLPHTLTLQIPSTAHVNIAECQQWTPCSLGKPRHVVCTVGENKYRHFWYTMTTRWLPNSTSIHTTPTPITYIHWSYTTSFWFCTHHCGQKNFLAIWICPTADWKVPGREGGGISNMDRSQNHLMKCNVHNEVGKKAIRRNECACSNAGKINPLSVTISFAVPANC